MSGMKRNLVLALAVAAAVAAPCAFATNGYFAHGYSIKEKGLAGAGVALPQDSLAAATNPAGMVMVGSRMDAGVSVFSPLRSYSTTGAPSGGGGTFPLVPESVDSDSEHFLIPVFGYNSMMDANSSLGISIYGNGGMNTDYSGSAGGGAGTFYGGRTGVDLSQLFVNATYARKMSTSSSWGVSGIFAYQRFKARGLSSFGGFSNDSGNLTDNGYSSSTGFGAKLGWLGQVISGVSLGASYQTKISMGEFDKYKGLFAENGGFDIPATATIGLAFDTTPKSKLTVDIQKIWYSDVKSIANSMSNLIDPTNSCSTGNTSMCLGGSDGAGFGWKDMTITKLGYQWQSSPDWTWRVGYSQGKQPIPSSEVMFNILAPAVIEQHYTFGFTTNMSKTSELNFAAMIAPEKKVSGTNPLEAPNQQTIELKMHQYEVAASWGWKF
jgi:long-chain fatty acid transport protein